MATDSACFDKPHITKSFTWPFFSVSFVSIVFPLFVFGELSFAVNLFHCLTAW